MDTTDNITGLPGMGPKSVQKILSEVQKPGGYIPRVIKEYQMKFGVIHGTDMFTEMWMLVKMRPKRGDKFISQYQSMFDLKQSLLLRLGKANLGETVSQ